MRLILAGVAPVAFPRCDRVSIPNIHPSTEAGMADHVYRVTEIVGSSPESLQQAIRNGVARASQTLRNLEWFEVTEIRGQIADGEVAHFQVGLKVGFRLDDAG
jgi:dodecin